MENFAKIELFLELGETPSIRKFRVDARGRPHAWSKFDRPGLTARYLFSRKPVFPTAASGSGEAVTILYIYM